jgi:hypothetical protein
MFTWISSFNAQANGVADQEVPDTHYSGWRWESKGLTGSVNLILLFIGGTMITASVLSLGAFDLSSIDACLPSPRDSGR